jgi:hypothetical protein
VSEWTATRRCTAEPLAHARSHIFHTTSVNIQEVIIAVNQMQADGVIDRYAVGGDAATSLYLESVSPRHVDVFVGLKSEPGQLIFSPEPIAMIEGAHIRVGDTPALFVPPPTPLLKEAMTNAAERNFDGVMGRVFTADYLAAIAFQSGRANARLLDLAAADVLNLERFQDIITRYGLLDRWREFLVNQR